MNLPVMSYGRTPEQVRDFYRDVQRRISALPGVEHVSSGFGVPWRDARALTQLHLRRGRRDRAKTASDDLRARFRSISPGFFATLGVPILQGRDFKDTDGTARNAWSSSARASRRNFFPGRKR